MARNAQPENRKWYGENGWVLLSGHNLAGNANEVLELAGVRLPLVYFSFHSDCPGQRQKSANKSPLHAINCNKRVQVHCIG